MNLETQRCKQLAVCVAAWLAFAATAQAGDPEPAAEPAPAPRTPKPVRQAGGERGPNLDLKRASEAEPGPGGDVAASDRARLQDKFRAAHEAIKRAREQRHDLKDARERMKLEASGDPAAATGEGEAVASDEERAQNRLERGKRARRMAWRGMMHRFKRPADIPPDIRKELRQHARRLARLQRIRAVAQEKLDQGVLTRIDKLMTREQERHQKQMRTHWDALAQTQAATGPAAPPAADPKAAPAPDPDELGDDPDPETPEDEDEEQGGEP